MPHSKNVATDNGTHLFSSEKATTTTSRITGLVDIEQQRRRNYNNLSTTSSSIGSFPFTTNKVQDDTIPNLITPSEMVSSFVPVTTTPKAKKMYPCSRCPKAFNRPSALETHSYTHTAEKPFQCHSPGCGRKFSVLSNLRRHLKIHQKKSSSLHNKTSSRDRI